VATAIGLVICLGCAGLRAGERKRGDADPALGAAESQFAKLDQFLDDLLPQFCDELGRPLPDREARDPRASCEAGGPMDCLARLNAHTIDINSPDLTIHLVIHSCPRAENAQWVCHGAVSALADNCKRGGWASCYLAANACSHGHRIPSSRRHFDDDVGDD
jgi:hypothetical protein